MCETQNRAHIHHSIVHNWKSRTCAERILNRTADWLWNVAGVIYCRYFFGSKMLECNNSIIVNAILICDSRLQSAQNKRKTYQYTQWSIDTMSWREKASNQLFLFPVEKLKSQLLAAYSLLGSVHALRFITNAYEPKIINEFTTKKKISSQLVVQLFFPLLLASFNGFVWIYSSIFFGTLCVSFALQFNFGFKWENTSNTRLRLQWSGEHSTFTHFGVTNGAQQKQWENKEENIEIRTPSALIRARARVRDNERAESNDTAQRVQSHTIEPHSSWAVN